MASKNKRFSTLQYFSLLFCLFCLTVHTPLYAKDFKQTLHWNADPNVLEYKVDIQNSAGKIIKSITTEDNSLSLSLGEGSYKYRVTAYDFLGREAVSTNWISFEVAIAKQPEIKHEKKLESLAEDGKSLEMNLNVADVTSDTVAELVNVETGAKISGKLVISSSAGAPAAGLSSSETHTASKARFTDVPEGNWKLVVTNPSGLSSETESFEVKDTIKEERIAAAKAEEERLAREQAEREAAERERLAREEAERQEQERIAREKAEQEERERLAREQAEREEAERLAREEEERLAREEEERKEAECLAKEEEKEKKKNMPAKGIEVKLGPAMAYNLFDSDILKDKNHETLFKDTEMNNMSFGPMLSASYVPDWLWRVNPGIELSSHVFSFGIKNGKPIDSRDDFEVKQVIYVFDVHANLIGQIHLIPNKINANLKAGGGLSWIQVETIYHLERDNRMKGYYYPKINAGASIELIPIKRLVFELGVDYNKVVSSKVNFSYVLPYFEVGVRF